MYDPYLFIVYLLSKTMFFLFQSILFSVLIVGR